MGKQSRPVPVGFKQATQGHRLPKEDALKSDPLREQP
jgi:hypothetical protein